ncbi:transcription factor FapR [Clostridiaceae bacterium HSG29]|nr:transcription factor FapR [Clostridiaceae bacterium HSG29]
MKKIKKSERHQEIKKVLKNNPFFTDEELSEKFGVSVQTIRLDRMSLNIPELRERVKSVATKNLQKVKSLGEGEIVGELIDLQLNKNAISILQTDESMAFSKTKIVKGHYIFAMAETLALAVIESNVALIGVANVKYRVPVKAGEKLVAKAEVINKRGSEYFVRVWINVNNDQVFRSKFRLVSIDLEV